VERPEKVSPWRGDRRAVPDRPRDRDGATATLVDWDGAPTDSTFKRLVRDISGIIASQPRTDDQGTALTTGAIETIAKTRKWRIRPDVKVVVAAVVTTLLVSAGALVYRSQESRLHGEKDEIARTRVYSMIQSGAERAWFTCTQFDLLKRKEAGLRSARLIQDANLEEGLRNQIRDHNANIADAFHA
jgi:hypothetical protein